MTKIGGSICIREYSNNSGKDIANRIIVSLEHFVHRGNTNKMLDTILNVTDDEELTLINYELNEYFKTVEAKKPNLDFDYKKYKALRINNMYPFGFKDDNRIDIDYFDYPANLVISKKDYKKLVEFNPDIVENDKILDMKVIKVNQVYDRRR